MHNRHFEFEPATLMGLLTMNVHKMYFWCNDCLEVYSKLSMNCTVQIPTAKTVTADTLLRLLTFIAKPHK